MYRALVIFISFLIDTIISVVETLAIMFLWNWLAINVFSAPTMSFWVAFGIFCIIDIVGSIIRNEK